MMNAGAYGGEMKDILKEVLVLTPEGLTSSFVCGITKKSAEPPTRNVVCRYIGSSCRILSCGVISASNLSFLIRKIYTHLIYLILVDFARAR